MEPIAPSSHHAKGSSISESELCQVSREIAEKSSKIVLLGAPHITVQVRNSCIVECQIIEFGFRNQPLLLEFLRVKC